MALRTVGVKLTADISQYTSALARAGAATKDFSKGLDQAAQKGHLDKVADTAGVVGIGLAGMAGVAIKAAADFDKAMSGVEAATHASAGEISKLRAAALQAGKDTQYSATEAAQGITELSKAGVSTADILGGGLKGALSLAAAGQIDVGQAAETAASAMTQFGLSGKDIPHVADLLAAAAGKAQGSVGDMGYALKQSGLVAAQFGLSVEDTTGTLAAFASAGLTGSDAGTSFKTMLLALANPAAKTKDAMDELGISAYDAQGKFVGITGLAQQLHDKLANLTQAQRDQTLAMIFGTDAIRGANVLYKEGGQGIQDWINKVNDSGYASKTAADLTNNLSGDIERLKGSIETLAISSGSGANGGLRILVKALDGMVGQFLNMPSAVGGTLTVLAAVGGAALLALAGFVKLRKGLAEAVTQLEAMGPAGEKAAVGLQRTAGAAGKAAVAFVALEASAAVLNSFGRKAADVDKLTDSLTNLANTGKVSGEAADKFGKNLDGLSDDAAIASSGVLKWIDNVSSGIPVIGDAAHAAIALGARLAGKDDYATAVQNFQNLDQALTSYMQTSGDAKKSSELFNEVVSKSGLDADQVAKLLPNAWKEVGKLNQAQMDAERSGKGMGAGTKAAAAGASDLAGAAGPAAAETKKLTTATDAAAAAARGQRDALKSLSDFMKQETDPVFNLIKAQDDLVAAQKNYSKAVKDHGKNSAEAKQADRELALAAIALQGAVGDVSSNFNGKMTPALEKTLKAAGLSREQIKLLEKQFKDAKAAADKYDGNYAAKGSAPGVKESQKALEAAYKAALDFDGTYNAYMKTPGGKEAEKQVRTAWDLLNKYDGGWTAALHTTGYTKVANDLRHLLAAQQALKDGTNFNEANRELGHFFSRGGPVVGPGTGTSDSIPARLSAGEFVMKASSVEKLGTSLLSYMNRTGSMPDSTPGFAGGGIVMPFPTTASRTKIPAVDYGLPGGGGAPGYKWMEKVVRAAFPGIAIYSDYRPGAITVTGNRSYHAVGRAVDFAPSLPLAEWINLHFMKATKELITPWQSLNIWNGRRHHYSDIVERGHDFAHGNAHDHWAMANGGVITEPIFGVGASGRTYSFGENYQPERVTPMWHGGGGGTTVSITFAGPVGSQYELQTWLEGSIDDLRRKGKL
jgi:TP901 family phage tail tape measure protein